MPKPFDIVTVPDFAGRKAHVFEATTLTFLASWLKNAGEARNLPLHLACIGTPPDSVQRLAAKAHAHITVHSPIGLRRDHHVGNKLRGLEISPCTEHVLLIDTDTIFTGDISSLSDLGNCIAASPADGLNMAEVVWRKIYDHLGVPMPGERMASIHAEMGLPAASRRALGHRVPRRQHAAMPPYYNGGVVFAPWNCGLRELWATYIERIAKLFDEQHKTAYWVYERDQPALAVVTQILRERGFPFRRIPDEFHARWRHFYAGRLSFDTSKIVHLTGFLGRLEPGPLDEQHFRRGIEQYCHESLARRHWRILRSELVRLRPGGLPRYWRGQTHLKQLEQLLNGLVDTHILPVLNKGTHAGSRRAA